MAISTSPIAFKEGFTLPIRDKTTPGKAQQSDDWQTSIGHLHEAIEHCVQTNRKHNTKTSIALEPEPACVIETLDEVKWLFKTLNLDREEQQAFGLCFDCCHQAVQFESVDDWLKLFSEESISLHKVQVSSALLAKGRTALDLLGFDEPSYLHQCVLQTGGRLFRLTDLDQLSLFEESFTFDETRCHFHVPVFAATVRSPAGSTLDTTQSFLADFLPRIAALKTDLCFEVETYSFDALPESVQLKSLPENIERELRWTATMIGGNAACRG